MKLFIQHDNYGNIQAVSSYAMGVPENFSVPIGSTLVDSDIPESVLVNEYKVIGGTLVWVGAPIDVETYDLNMTTLNWEINIVKLRAKIWALIKRDREATINAPLVTPYGTFDSDPKSRQNITDAILMLKSLEDLGSPTTIDFTLADDTARTLTTAEMVMVGLLLGQKIQAAHAQARALRGALDLATTKEEVEAITWQATT